MRLELSLAKSKKHITSLKKANIYWNCLLSMYWNMQGHSQGKGYQVVTPPPKYEKIIIRVFYTRTDPSLQTQELRLQFCQRQAFHRKLRNQGCSFTRD